MKSEHRGGAYVRELLKPATLARIQNAGRGGAVVDVRILHDNWCPLLAGTGPCNCTPDVAIRAPRRKGAA